MFSSVCAAHQGPVKKFSSNGQVPLARGVRADGRDRLVTIIAPLESAMHKEARDWKSTQRVGVKCRILIHAFGF